MTGTLYEIILKEQANFIYIDDLKKIDRYIEINYRSEKSLSQQTTVPNKFS